MEMYSGISQNGNSDRSGDQDQNDYVGSGGNRGLINRTAWEGASVCPRGL